MRAAGSDMRVRRRCGAPHPGGEQLRLDLRGTVGVCVLRAARACGAASPICARAAGVSSLEVRGHLFAVRRDQHLAPGLEELLDALPRVGDEAGAGARGLEDARRPARSRSGPCSRG